VKKLIIGQIPENFDPDIHIPIAPNCFISKEDIYPDFENLDYLRIVESRIDIKNYDQICTEEALYWVNIIAKKYNPDEFDKHNFRFWKTIYFPWLGLVIPWFYRKQLLIIKIIEKYRNENITVELIEENLSFEVKNEIDFIIDGIWNQTINDWIYARIIESNLPDKWNINYKEDSYKSDKETISRFNKSKSLKSKIAGSIRKIGFRSKGVSGFNIVNEIFFHFLQSFKPSIEVNRDVVLNHKVSQINWSFNIVQIIEFLIPQSLAKINFDESKRKFRKGKLINYTNRLYYDLNTKIDAAYAYEKNEIVISTQHGGHNYGSAYTFEYGTEIEFKFDIFISWGWKNPDIRVLELVSPLLSKILNIHKKSNNKIIMVGTDMKGFPSRFDSGPNEIPIIEYRKNKLGFIKNLEPELKSDFLYRPYPEKKTSFSDSNFILNQFPELIIHKGDLHSDLKKCNLLVLDHPGTTWNIAMAMNTPIICYWNREHFPFNKEADLFLDRLKKQGLYFENPEEASEKVNLLVREYENLSIWWNQKEIQDLRKDWMHVYAKADKNWFWIWTKALWKLK
jgi:putative transferase (TIGR04331 family)